MKIEGSSLNALFSSSESLESMQQTLQLDGSVSQGFADTLKDKIRQLGAMKEVAGEKGETEDTIGFAELFGKALPSINQLEENIDLEDTLEALSNVMNMLEGLGTEEIKLEEKLAGLVEKLESITTDISNSAALEEKLALVVDKLKQMKDIILNEDGLENNTLSLEDQSEILESQIEQLFEDVEAMKKPLLQNNSEKTEPTISSVLKEDKLTETPVVPLHTLISSEVDKVQESEKSLEHALPELKANLKKEVFSLKPISEERSIGISSKADSDTLLQQENAFAKQGQDNLFNLAKHPQGNGFLDEMDFELSNDKSLPKFATDIALLNKMSISENKVEIPPMSKHFAHPEWNKEIGERVLWMHKQAIPSAELRLNPKHLGPITIKVDVTQDQATVAFSAQHATVKEAIEAAIPKLRDMFSAQQLNLVDVDVTQDDKEQRQSKAFSQMESGQGNGEQKDSEQHGQADHPAHIMDITDEIEAGRAIASNGILSLFA